MDRGYVQVYTGEGKGKTTAALGLAIRAAGAGLTVYIAQFMKAKTTSETLALSRFNECIELQQFGCEKFVDKKPSEQDILKALKGVESVREKIGSHRFDLVVLDEISTAIHCGVVDVSLVTEIIDKKPPQTELVLTGRHAPQEIVSRADLVTEMREVKHYFRKGVRARRGIEF